MKNFLSVIFLFFCLGLKAGPFTVFGAIGVKYAQLGGKYGLPVLPLMNEAPTSDGAGRYQRFQGCTIYWHPSLGAYEVHGDIYKRFIATGAEKYLGYPVTDESVCPDNKGRYNHFKRLINGSWADGSIYWTPKLGAFPIYGAIRAKWASMGWERSKLGYPKSAEYQAGSYRRQDFEKGYILWSGATGAKEYITSVPFDDGPVLIPVTE